jgi:hypothetical protein
MTSADDSSELAEARRRLAEHKAEGRVTRL